MCCAELFEEEEESGKGKAAAKAATKRDKSQSAPSQSAANFLHIPRMSTRNRPAEYARTASQSNAIQADTHEVASATLPDAHTHLIGDSYEKGGVEVSVSYSHWAEDALPQDIYSSTHEFSSGIPEVVEVARIHSVKGKSQETDAESTRGSILCLTTRREQRTCYFHARK